MSVERITSVAELERCLDASASQPVYLLKHSTT
jgi:hypothetical protein